MQGLVPQGLSLVIGNEELHQTNMRGGSVQQFRQSEPKKYEAWRSSLSAAYAS